MTKLNKNYSLELTDGKALNVLNFQRKNVSTLGEAKGEETNEERTSLVKYLHKYNEERTYVKRVRTIIINKMVLDRRTRRVKL